MGKIAKFAIWVIALAGFAILFLIYDMKVVAPTVTVDDVKLIEIKTSKQYKRSFSSNYGVSENDMEKLLENNTKLKKAIITFKYENNSFFHNFYEVQGKYVTPENLPPVVIGKKPDIPTIESLHFYSRTHQRRLKNPKFPMTVLIEPKNYSDAEILAMLKTVEVMLIEEIPGQDKIYYSLTRKARALLLGGTKGKVQVLARLPLAK